MPNVFPDDILARIRAVQVELAALTRLVSDGYVDVGDGFEPGNPTGLTMRLYVVDNAGTAELHAKDWAGNDYTLVP